jgi:flagellin-like hook-associated protein FlgL
MSLRSKEQSFRSLSTISGRSFEEAKKSIDVIRFSLKSISQEAARMGGLSNQLNDAILNLSNSKTIEQTSVGRLEDLDVPKTVVSLQKSNYIQTVATAMLNRVKSTMEAVLQILER